MKDGIYRVVFTTDSGSMGNGVCITRGDAVVGVNFGYTFHGKVQGGADAVTAPLRFEAQHGFQPVLPLPRSFELTLQGQEQDDRFELRGLLPVGNVTLLVVGEWIE